MASVRFTPHWNPDDIRQAVGFLHLVNAVLKERPDVKKWVEVGSYLGESATLLAGFPQLEEIHLVEASQVHAEALREKFAGMEQVTVHNVKSPHAAELFNDKSVDVVYIDADHSFDAVCADIEAWTPKAKAFVCGHDYHDGFPGVIRAVDGLLGEPRTFCDSSWMVEVK